MNNRYFLALAFCLAASVLVANQASAQTFTLQVDRGTGDITILNPDPATLTIDFYNITSAAGSLDPGTISPDTLGDAAPGDVDAANWISLQDQADPDRIDPTEWRELAPSINSLGEGHLPGGSTPITDADSFSLGNIFSIAGGQANAGFLANVEDLQVVYGVPSTTGGVGEILTGDVVYVGDEVFNNLVLNVDALGNASIENQSQTTVNLTGYSIASAAGGLDTAFTGLGGSFEDANSTVDALAELLQTGALAIAPGTELSIGQISDGNIAAEDLDFDFTLSDVGFNEAAIDGVTLVEVSTTTPGDFDVDGDVDGADFLLFQQGGSPDPLSLADLTDFLTNYGTGAGAAVAAATAVPEPNSAALLLLGSLALAGLRRNNR